MSAEFMSTEIPDEESKEEAEDSFVKLIKSMSGDEFIQFYRTVLNIQGGNRHQNPEFQVRLFLQIPRDELELMAQASLNIMRKDK